MEQLTQEQAIAFGAAKAWEPMSLVALLLDALPVWRPIETAPKITGQNILLISGNFVTVGHWHPNGFWFCNGPSYSVYRENEQPDHWQPLPAPPITKGPEA